MENSSSKPLAVESFSHTWLTNVNSFLDCLEEQQPIDHLYATRPLLEIQNFKFDVQFSSSSSSHESVLVHADQLFSDGLIKPAVFINHHEQDSCHSFDSGPLVRSSSCPSSRSEARVQIEVLKGWRKVLRKCFRYARVPFCCRRSRKSTRVDDIDTRAWEVQSQRNSPKASPSWQQQRMSYSSSDTHESSIYEAILHCKRSMDK